ncbi:MAG: 16S rRNA processing protein RimM [Clostridia bacterium]|nr:16S rRNA processing protein RimM [Clostridia bacterium]
MLLCAEIVNTHGIRGEVKALPYADNAGFFDGIKRFKTDDGQTLTLQSFRTHKGALIMKFAEIPSITEAEGYKGKKLYIDRKDAPKPPEGRYFIVDIIGCKVVTDTGRELGKVVDVLQAGANDVYTVKSAKGKEYLIPVINDVVQKIDVENKQILITPLKGLLDDEN